MIVVIPEGSLLSNVTVSSFNNNKERFINKALFVSLQQHYEMLFPSRNWLLPFQYSQSLLVCSITYLFHRQVDK